MVAPRVGEVWQSRFDIVQPLGEGGAGSVYRARDAELGIDVTLKVIRATGDENTLRVEEFQREVAALRELQNPNIIQILDAGVVDDDTRYIVFEHVDGEDLGRILAQNGRIPWRTASHIVLQVLDALAEAHERGIIHRDIKPHNLLIHRTADDPWRVKLLDFGIAKPRFHHDELDAQLTAMGARIGTPDFMSPEQLLARSTVSTASDLFSVALVFVAAVGGEEARAAAQGYGVHTYQGHDAKLDLAGLGSPPLQGWTQRMLSGLPANRFSSARQARNALLAALQNRTSFTLPDPRRNISKATAIAVLGGIILAAGAAAYVMQDRHDPNWRREELPMPAPAVVPPSTDAGNDVLSEEELLERARRRDRLRKRSKRTRKSGGIIIESVLSEPPSTNDKSAPPDDSAESARSR